MRPALPAALALTALVGTAVAQPMIRAPAATDTLAIVTHVDVLPDHMTAARDALAAYVRAARGEPGALRVEAMQEVRQNHFDLVETWRDAAARRAHQASAAILELRAPSAPGSAARSTSGSARRVDKRHCSPTRRNSGAPLLSELSCHCGS